jgi:spore germination protein YaaH
MTQSIKKQHFLLFLVAILFLSSFLVVPTNAFGANQQVAAWIPWWLDEKGAESTLQNIRKLDVLYPFVYEVNEQGELKNLVDFDDEHWEDLFTEAKRRNVQVIPTIAWFDGPAIHEMLSDRRTRERHVEDIVQMVRQNRFDGVNIDYESKLAETKDYFSTFLKELQRELGNRRSLTCTIEARIPPESRWRVVPDVVEYANDYRAMNKYCDWVEIMAYDQQRSDWQINEKRRGVPYAPVADTVWVEKVIELALEEIDSDKILLGVPTYGRAWDVTVAADWYKDYTRVASLNQPRILELAEKYNAPIGRAEGGEAVISYFPEDSVWKLLNQLPTPAGTPVGYEAAAKALLVATYADIEVPVRFVSWSDSVSISERLELVEKYNLRGTAIFKVDGEEDERIWKLF